MAQFTNFATLSYNGQTVSSNTVTGELLETVTVTKTSTAERYSADDDLTYIVSLSNSGTAAVTGLTLTDDLGGYDFDGNTVYPLRYRAGSLRLLADGVPQPAPTVNPGPPLSVSGLSIPAGGTAVLVYEAVTTAYAPPAAGGTVTNTVSVTGGGLAAPVTASVTLSAAENPAPEITKSLSPAAVSAGDTLTYTFLIENYGNAPITAADGVVMNDTFSPRLSGLTVTWDGAAWTAPANYSYDAATGVFASAAGAVTLPAAACAQGPDGTWTVTPGSATLVISGTVLAGDTAN